MASRGASNIFNKNRYYGFRPPRFVAPKQPYFTVRYTPQNIPTSRAKKFSCDLFINLYALRPKIDYMWATRDKRQLWWSASAQSDIASEKSVIRSWCARRVRTAFRDALRERGYDKTGRRIPDIEQREQQKPQPRQQAGQPPSRLEALEGTLEIHFRLAVKAAKYTDIVREAGVVIERIETYLKRVGEREENDVENSSDALWPSNNGVST
ncbi:hypothetical protein BDBG_06891 [Blastomyces gilchristii SLH14081]|uniref:Uncharacterized protein n=1 Tax=Blastomyces gilchristii (strain SLH14081) TaxID=559298 RepID=A0A179UW88_BLAGS|nr:uncharacterized protein BDBG_06891 [Blastomyces gilchristii SLH14081]OAT11388.1 hypothetical protein BDBG_06891 [Blastomyces gilchristii SLH14081]